MNIKETYKIILIKHNDIKPPNIPPLLMEFIVLGEDRKYYYHLGIDPVGIIRAIIANIYGELQGASTITQQYIRVLSCNYEMTYKRKIKEILLALLLNYKFEKVDVIRKYLAIAYYGYNMEGINNVCKKNNYLLNALNVGQAASIIACLKYPKQRYYIKERHDKLQGRTNFLCNKYYCNRISLE
jgi:penicillin-binding protein 1A